MVESQTRLGKPSWASDAVSTDAREDEQAVDFKFFITWSSLFPPLGISKSGDAGVPLNHRAPTLVSSLRESAVQREERESAGHVGSEGDNLAGGTLSSRRVGGFPEISPAAAQSLEKAASSDRPEADANFSVAWEMVVPKMVRSTLKALPSEPKPPMFQIQAKKIFQLPLGRLGIGLAITLVGVLALLFLHREVSSTPKRVAPVPVVIPALRLEVEPEQNGLVTIRWNPVSAAVTRAREGRLVIVERDQQPKTLALNTEQLKTGHLSFQPLGDRVVFRLEVVDGSGTLVKESVLAQSSSVPVAASTEAPAQTQPVPATKPVAVGKAELKPDGSAVVPPVLQPARPTREFTPPPSNHTSSVDGRGPLPDPPAAEIGASPVAPLRIPDPGERAGLNRIAPPPAKPTPATVPVKVGGNFQAGKLIKKVLPIYPFMAESARVQGTVRFTAIIAKDGTIQNLQLVSGPSMLVKAATDAVKQWVYQPTVLNGEPMEVQTQIEVNFNLSQ